MLINEVSRDIQTIKMLHIQQTERNEYNKIEETNIPCMKHTILEICASNLLEYHV